MCEDEGMQIQLIRNATLRMTYGNRVIITDPYLAPKHSQEPLVGKSRNPMVDLPFPPEEVLADIEMVLIRFHFSSGERTDNLLDWRHNLV